MSRPMLDDSQRFAVIMSGAKDLTAGTELY